MKAQDLSDNEYELLEAAEKGETNKVLDLLNKNVNPNIHDWYGMSPLHYAAQNNHLSTVKVLILNKTRVDIQDYDDRTSLHLAVHFNHLEIAEFLVQHKADINASDSYGLSPLFYASAYGDFLMTDMFLFYAEGKQVKDPEGKTPFLVAVWGGHLANSELLLKYFSKIDEMDNQGNNALHLAVLNKDIEMIDSLVAWGCDINAVNKDGYSCVDLAIQEDDALVLQKLISLNAPLDHQIKKGLNSLDLALHITQNPQIISLLENAGAQRNKRISLSQAAISVNFNTGFQDMFSTLKMELWEPKYGFGLSLGVSQRLGRLKVLSPMEDNVRYQFRETQTGILAGVEKQWMLLRLNRTNRIGLNMEFDLGLFMGHNKASDIPPDKIWAPMPSLGLYWQSGPWQIGFSGLYQNMKTYQLPALRLGLTMAYRFNELK